LINQFNIILVIAAFTIPDLEKKPTEEVLRPLKGTLFRVSSLILAIMILYSLKKRFLNRKFCLRQSYFEIHTVHIPLIFLSLNINFLLRKG